MAVPSRSAQFTKLHKVLKKHYAPVEPDPSRSVLEHLLFASCLENAPYAAAEESLAALVNTFFDWNEIRVSTVRELAEVIAGLPDPMAAATRVKKILQTVFEATYSFDLEELRKQNLGPAVERLEKTEGTSKFSVAYVVQAALGGHAIPLDAGAFSVLRLLDFVTDQDVAEGAVPGLERAIAKNAGVDFGSLLHQVGADYLANPYSQSLHSMLIEIEPEVKQRLPSRRAKKTETASPGPQPPAVVDGKGKKSGEPTEVKLEPDSHEKQSEKSAKGPGKATSKPSAKATHAEPVKENAKPAKEGAKQAGKEPPSQLKKKPSKTESAAGPQEHSLKKKPAAKKKPEPSSRQHSSTSGIAKRKPR